MTSSLFRLLGPITLLALGACASPLRIKVPVLRFESPELEGPAKESFNFAGGVQSYNEAELSPDMNTTRVHDVPVTTRQGFLGQESDDLSDVFDFSYLFLRLGYSLPIPLEITWRFPDRLGLKFQFLGPRASDAKSGSFSAALTASYGKRGLDSTSGSDEALTSFASYSFSRELIDTALVLGLRFSDDWMVYGGPFYFTSPYSVTQNTTTSLSSQTVEGEVTSVGGNLGLQWRSADSFMLRLEVAANTLKAHRHQQSYVHGGLALSKSF
jgi:hypothetical protein